MTNGLYLHISKSKGYALFLSLIPVLLMYRFPGLGIGISTLMILIGLVYSTIVIILNVSKVDFRVISVVLIYLIYVFIKSTGMDAVLPIIILVHILAISTGFVDVYYLRKYIETISAVASICLISQVVIHTIFGIHVPLINSNYIIESLSDYIRPINTGYSGAVNFYRPSAFFLEPSHFTQYCILGLGSRLFSNNRNKKVNILITLGIFLTTSGMGFVLVFAIWGWWYISNYGKNSLKQNAGRILLVIVLIPVIIYVMSRTQYFGNVINRFLLPENSSGSVNAISGRTFWWNTYFRGLSWRELIFGFGSYSLPDRYFTGFMTVLYAYGIIGVVLLIISYINIALRDKSLARTFCIMYIGLFFLANLTGMLNIIFCFGVIITLYKGEEKCKKDSQ